MLNEDKHYISELNKKIEKALEDYNFIALASLSSKLEKTVKSLTDKSSYGNDITDEELATLEGLVVSVNRYQAETESKFKEYTLRVSKQTKMQSAYKKSGG